MRRGDSVASVVKGPGLPHTDYKVGTEIQAYDSVDVTGGGGSKRSPFGAPDFTPLVARVCLTPFSERSTAKLQALAWRPTESGHRTCQRADDLGIAIPSVMERLWPALKFQDFLRLSRGRDHYFTTSPRENPEKSSTFSRET